MSVAFNKIGGFADSIVSVFQGNCEVAFQKLCDAFASIDRKLVAINESLDTLASLNIPNERLFELIAVNYTATTNIFSKSNVPIGEYRVTVGARYHFTKTSGSAYQRPYVNGVQLNGIWGTSWFIGPSNTSLLTGEHNFYLGFNSTQTAQLPNTLNAYYLNINVAGSSQVERPHHSLLRVNEAYNKITTEWN